MKANLKTALGFVAGALAALAVVGVWPALRKPAPDPNATSIGTTAAPASRVAVEVTGAQARNIGLKLTRVTKGPVNEDLQVVATVVPDESRISHIHARASGWIEKLYVPNTGEMVNRGQPIADLFSQEVYSSQLDHLSARAFTGPASAVVASGRARLEFFGMRESDIQAIEKTGKARRVITLYAPASGILAHRGATVGTSVDPSTEIAIVLDLSRVWVIAEVPERSASLIRKGMPARIQLGGFSRQAAVEFIDPMLSETRSLKVRFSLPNADGSLRPGMYGTAAISTARRSALTVPRDAVADTGAAQYVYVQPSAGVYLPRQVRVGVVSGESAEIVDGLVEGEMVVASGVFLLDSESRLRASGGQGTSHGSHGKERGQPPGQPPGGHSHD